MAGFDCVLDSFMLSCGVCVNFPNNNSNGMSFVQCYGFYEGVARYVFITFFILEKSK